MKHTLTTLLFSLGLFMVSHAQRPEPLASTDAGFSFGEWSNELHKNKTAVIFADVCNVRSAPDAQAAVSGKLTIGTPVEVLDVTATKFTQNGLSSPWVKIKSGTVTGYIWGGLLTNGALKLPDGKMVVWGITQLKTDENQIENYTASVRLADKGVVVDKHDVSLRDASRPKDGYLQCYPAPQLTGVKNVVTLETLSEACGVTATSHFFLYTGSRLVFVGSGHSMGDGGQLHSSLQYVFPYPKKDDDVLWGDYHYMPTENHVFRIQNDAGYDDDCQWDENYKVKDFIWQDGKLSKSCEY